MRMALAALLTFAAQVIFGLGQSALAEARGAAHRLNQQPRLARFGFKLRVLLAILALLGALFAVCERLLYELLIARGFGAQILFFEPSAFAIEPVVVGRAARRARNGSSRDHTVSTARR